MSATAAATHAVARDAAYLIAGMAGRQRYPASVIRVTARIMAMELQSEVGQRPGGRKHGRQPEPPATSTSMHQQTLTGTQTVVGS